MITINSYTCKPLRQYSSMKKEHQEELSKLQEQLSKVDASSSGSTEEKPAKVTKGGRFNIRKTTVR